MLVYASCPSCSRTISYDIDKYYEESEAIASDPNKTKEQKNISGAKLLDKYGFVMICCRSRIMGLIPYHKIISS